MRALKILLAGLFTAVLVVSPTSFAQVKTATRARPSTDSIEQLLARHETAEAEKRLSARLSSHPSDVHAMVLFGAMREQQHLYKQAEAAYKIALRTDPASVEATIALAKLLTAEDRIEEATQIAEMWHTADPSSPIATLMLSRLYERRGLFEQSLQTSRTLPANEQIQVLPTVITDRMMLHQESETPALIAELFKHSTEHPNLISELAASLLRHGRVADAAELLHVASERLKPTAELLAAAAEAEGRQGHLEQARQLAERARRLDSKSPEPLIISAQLASVQKDWKLATDYLEQLRKLAPPKITSLQNLTYGYMQLRDYDRAHSSALEWHELQPDSIDASLALSIVFVAAKHWGEASTLLDTVLTSRPTDKAAHLGKGMALYNLGDLDAAAQHLTASLGQGVADGDAYYHLGLIAKQHGDITTATKEMAAAVQADPEHQSALASLGIFYAQQGNLEAARSSLEKAIQELPEDSQSHYQLALVYRRLSMADKAREQLEIYQTLIKKSAATSKDK